MIRARHPAPSPHLGLRRAVTLLVLGLIWGCGGPAVDERSSLSDGRAAAPRDVILVTVDTLRADALGFAGHPRVATPVLDGMAARGRVFTQARAHNVVTLPSHANILTGRLPFEHGVRDNGGFVLGEDQPTLATLLSENGFATAAFVAAYPLDARYGLARGFDVYDDVDLADYGELVGGLPDPRRGWGERRGDEVVADALDWWQRNDASPRFLWLHLFDPHAPYRAPAPFAGRHPDEPYYEEVEAVDAFLEPVVALLDAESPPLLLLTSDHGEGLGEHGEATHGLFAYEATLAVPLVVAGPGVEPGRDDRPARHVDLLPTVLGSLGLEAPQDLPGQSLLGPPPAAEAADVYFESLSPHLNHGWAPLRGLVRDGRKMIEQPLPELYDLPADPRETDNLADRQRPALRGLMADLPTESRWPPEASNLSAEETARLRSLGYLSSRGAKKRSFGPEDDLKNLVGVHRDLQEMVLRFHEGNLQNAEALARGILERRDDMPLAHTFLAQTLLARGDATGALGVMENAVSRGVAEIELRRELGMTLLGTGRAADAAEVLEALTADTRDPLTLNNLGLALATSGQTARGIAVLEDAAREHPTNAATRENLAYVTLGAGDPAAAEAHARAAVDLAPDRATAWNNLALALYEQGRRPEALDAWRAGVAADPSHADSLFNLGAVAAEDPADPDTARRALRAFLESDPNPRDPRTAEARRLLVELAR
ncbi:MAG: sulfatase-like hydrolase/transferase [Acidobacteriota bacterium]